MLPSGEEGHVSGGKSVTYHLFLYIFRKYIGKYFPIAYAVVMLIVGILFITKIKIKKPGLKTMIFLILIGVIEIMFIIATKCL